MPKERSKRSRTFDDPVRQREFEAVQLACEGDNWKEQTYSANPIFAQFGFVWQGQTPHPNVQIFGKCPFCRKDKHFYIKHRADLWQCKKCGKYGNLRSFVTQKLTGSDGKFSELTQEQLEELEEHYHIEEEFFIRDTNKYNAILMAGNKVSILHETADGEIKFWDRKDFIMCYENSRKIIMSKKGKTKSIPYSTIWLQSPERKTYKKITFAPEITVPTSTFNLWRGFAVEPKEGDCDFYLKHIKDVICSGNEEHYRFLISWMADSVQNPSKPKGVCVVLRGEKGVGKGQFVKHFGSLFGNHYVHITQEQHLIGRFNAHLKACSVMFVDEAFWGGSKKGIGILNALITEPYTAIEEKFKDVYMAPNCLHIIMASNSDWVIPAGLKERRYLMLDVDNKNIQDIEYFRKLNKQMDNGGREALLEYLKAYQLDDGVNLRKPPETEALMEQKEYGFDSITSFWKEKLDSGKWYSGWMQAAYFFDMYTDYCNKMKIKFIESQTTFGRKTMRLFPDRDILRKEDKRRIPYNKPNAAPRTLKCYQFHPSIITCKKEFDEQL